MSYSAPHSHYLEVFIISWEGQESNAQHIAAAIENITPSLTIIYSHSNELPQKGPGNWIQVSNQFFYGKKFAKVLELYQGGNLLILHADAQTDDWPKLIKRAMMAFSDNPHLGVWAPRHTHTPWQWQDVCLGDLSSLTPQAVAQTDGIVVAYARPVIERLKQFSYDKNHYGWGIDWAAISYAYCHHLYAFIDPTIIVHHPATTQDHFSADAFAQMQEFFEQLSGPEKIMQTLLENHISLKKTGLLIGDDARQKQYVAEQELRDLRAYIHSLHHSLAWRLTKPVRKIRSKLLKLKRVRK